MDERLREREKGPDGNNQGMFEKRWIDHNFHEDSGESISMVEKRNIEVLNIILEIRIILFKNRSIHSQCGLGVFLYPFTCKTRGQRVERKVQHMYETSNVGKYQPVVIVSIMVLA